MNVLDNHITDLDNRIKEICKTAPAVEQSSIQESLSSYGWILLDSWIAWRTLRFLLKDQDIRLDIQKKWFQTPSSYTASQIKAVWHFDENVDIYLTKHLGCGLKHTIDDEIEKMRNSSAHFSNGGIVKGSDYQKISCYHLLFSNIFLLYEILSFSISISNNVLDIRSYDLMMVDENNTEIIKYQINNHAINFNFEIIDFNSVAIVKMGFNKQGRKEYLCFDKEGRCYLDTNKAQVGVFKIFSNKGYYRDTTQIKEKLKEQGF